MATKADDIIKRFDVLRGNRGNWEGHWQEIAELVYPQRQDFLGDRTEGDKRMEKVYDSTPIQANELLASGLHGMLTNPASKWFSLSITNREIAEMEDVKRWLWDVQEIMLAEIHHPKAKFSPNMHEVYMEFGAFATGVMFVGESLGDNSLNFSARPLSESYLAESADGIVDTNYRKFKWTVRQVVQRWTIEKVSKHTRELYEKKKFDDKVEILHAIQPRTDFNPRKRDRANMPVASVYMEKKENHILDDGGFMEMPIMAPRFSKTPLEIYGRGPATTSLPDIKMLNEMMKTTISAAQKVVNPPLLASDEGAIGPIRAIPNGINYFREGTTPLSALQTHADIRLGEELMQSVRNRIREAFFIDQLQLREGPQMTATEVLQRTEERLRLMGPVLGRVQTEFLGPMIDRSYGILERAGKFPEPPDAARGQELEVVYESPIARAQKTIETQGIPRTLEIMGPLIQADPSIMDRVDGDKAFKEVSETFGVNPHFMRDDAEVEAIRNDRAQSQQLQEGAALAEQGAGAVKDLAGAVS